MQIDQQWYKTTAKYDWFMISSGYRLHYARLESSHFTQLENTGYARAIIKLYCGIRVRFLYIPGILGRLATPRCVRCCKMFRIPTGVGSPRFDPECREVLGLPPLKRDRHEALQ